MHSLKFIRENIDLIKQDMKKRNYKDFSTPDKLLALDEQARKLKYEVDNLRSQRNTLSQEVNELKKQKKDTSSTLKKVKDIPHKIAEIEKQMTALQTKMKKLLMQIPNIMHDSVPLGRDEKDNPSIKEVGKIPSFDFEVKSHTELIENLGVADFESSAKTSGNGFYFIEGGLALLNQALITFAINFMHKKNYRYIETPLMIHKDVLAAAVDTETLSDTIYAIDGEDLRLIGTSEHSLLGRYIGYTFQKKELPQKVFSYSMCFRKEIGSHGIDEKGLWRTHQFNKVEQFVFCKAEDSYTYYDELLANTEELMQSLELPYRVIEICSGDLSVWKAKSADVEVWRPTTKEYGEVASLSNCTDFQARDLNIKVATEKGKEVVHTLNNTAIATSRILVAIIENYQNKDGSVTVPTILLPYMHGIKKISKNGN